MATKLTWKDLPIEIISKSLLLLNKSSLINFFLTNKYYFSFSKDEIFMKEWVKIWYPALVDLSNQYCLAYSNLSYLDIINSILHHLERGELVIKDSYKKFGTKRLFKLVGRQKRSFASFF